MADPNEEEMLDVPLAQRKRALLGPRAPAAANKKARKRAPAAPAKKRARPARASKPEPRLGWDATKSWALFRVLGEKVSVALKVSESGDVALEVGIPSVVSGKVPADVMKAYGALADTPGGGPSRSWDLTGLGITARQLAYLTMKAVVDGGKTAPSMHRLGIQDAVHLLVACDRLSPERRVTARVANALINTFKVRLVKDREGVYASRRSALLKPPPVLPLPRVQPWRIFSGVDGARPLPFRANVAITLDGDKVFKYISGPAVTRPGTRHPFIWHVLQKLHDRHRLCGFAWGVRSRVHFIPARERDAVAEHLSGDDFWSQTDCSLLDKHDCLITRLTGDLADAYVGWEGLAFSALGTMLGRAPRFPKRMAALKRSMDFKLADDDAQDAFCAAFAAWARQHQPDDDDDDEGPANAVRVWQLPPRFRMARMATAVAEAEFALPPRHSAPPRGRAGPSQPKASTCHLCRRGIRESGVLLGPSCRMRLHEAVGTYVKSEATKARLLQLLADDQLDEFDAILKDLDITSRQIMSVPVDIDDDHTEDPFADDDDADENGDLRGFVVHGRVAAPQAGSDSEEEYHGSSSSSSGGGSGDSGSSSGDSGDSDSDADDPATAPPPMTRPRRAARPTNLRDRSQKFDSSDSD